MKAMILAAGYGKRMLPLTSSLPKPLVQVQGRALIEYMLLGLAAANICEVIINVHFKAEAIVDYLGDGAQYGVNITYSYETEQLLGTGGGIKHSLPLLGADPFLLISGDILTNYDFSRLAHLAPDDLAHLVLVNNPEYKREGDFALEEKRVVLGGMQFTYANIALLSPKLFSSCAEEVFPLAPVLLDAIQSSQVSGEFYNGVWFNVGTPQIVSALNQHTGKPVLSGGCPKKRVKIETK